MSACNNPLTSAIAYLSHKVFLGMAASFVPPNRDIVALIEDVEAAGVRFVYFSPRNMRRSKVKMAHEHTMSQCIRRDSMHGAVTLIMKDVLDMYRHIYAYSASSSSINCKADETILTI